MIKPPVQQPGVLPYLTVHLWANKKRAIDRGNEGNKWIIKSTSLEPLFSGPHQISPRHGLLGLNWNNMYSYKTHHVWMRLELPVEPSISDLREAGAAVLTCPGLSSASLLGQYFFCLLLCSPFYLLCLPRPPMWTVSTQYNRCRSMLWGFSWVWPMAI